ncbi:MAG: DUF58 domain-containing protein [Thermoguttaceae bacterium]|nr:DUF58 domain-containing protein [Thermoguttaceae bacterium]
MSKGVDVGGKSSESYLDPRVAKTIERLDLKAQFIVKGFMHGLHASPLQGFSVEFSEHRKYERGDDPKDIDWRLYARTDKYYVRKYEAETNMTGWLVVDSSASMGTEYPGETTKFDYAISLAAALCHLMIHRQDPVGLVAFDEKIVRSVPPKSKRSQFGAILSTLVNLRPSGKTDFAAALTQFASTLKRASLVMIFSDLLGDPEGTLNAIYRLRHSGHDVILFHILGEAEAKFALKGDLELRDPETGESVVVDAESVGDYYREELERFRERFRREASNAKFDFVELDAGTPFDKALLEYLTARAARR